MAAIQDIDAGTLLPLLKTAFLGQSLLFEMELESTNATAAELAAQNAPEGLVVVADHQAAGRGRNGRSWFSPHGQNLYFSFVLRPPCPPGAVPQLAILSALSVSKAIDMPGVSVKWPNDVWLNGRKLCGILSTMSCTSAKTEYAVIGIGINVNIRDFPEGIVATSLAREAGRDFSRAAVLAAVLNTIEEDYLLWRSRLSLEPFMDRWRAISMLDGKTITAEHGHETLVGTASGITADGLLRLTLPNGNTTLIAAGDTHIIM